MQAIQKASKSLVTFFAVTDTMTQNIFTLDIYGHKIYKCPNGKGKCHTTCDGNFIQVRDVDKYYFDRNGRYVLGKEGEKIYKCAPCTSSYKIGDDGLFVKIIKDCGHSEKPNPKCGLNTDPNVFEMLPSAETVDIKNTLTSGAVKYLWDCLGHILPDVLFDTGETRPMNTIHNLASKLIFYKYHKKYTSSQLRDKVQKAEEFRNNIYKDRKDKIIALAKEYKPRQIQRRVFDDSDVVEEMHARMSRTKPIIYYDD